MFSMGSPLPVSSSMMSVQRTPPIKRRTDELEPLTEQPVQKKAVSKVVDVGELLQQNNNYLRDLNAKFDKLSTDTATGNKAVRDVANQNQTDIADLRSRIISLETAEPAPSGSSSEVVDRLNSLELIAGRAEHQDRQSEIIVSNVLVAHGSSIVCKEVFLKIAGYLKVQLGPRDVLFCRVLNRENRGLTTGPAPPPDGWNYMNFLVKLSSSVVKADLMRSYMKDFKLSNSVIGLSSLNLRIYINENLSSANYAIFKKAKGIFKVKNNKQTKIVESVYSLGGIVYVKDLNGDSHRVLTMADLQSIADQILPAGSE